MTVSVQALRGQGPCGPVLNRCDSDALLAALGGLVAERSGSPATGGFALFFIELHRSDRTRALAGVSTARDANEVVCQRIASILRPSDRFALFGVDHLMVLLPDVDSGGRAMLVATRLVQSLREPIKSPGYLCRMRAAVGCALFPAHGIDVESLVVAADQACRAARSDDHGYRVADRNAETADEANLAADLEAALHGNELEVWLQPQLDLRTGRFDAAEALIRWPRGEGVRPVSPIRVVQLAEDNGMMPALTQFVLNTVLRRSAMLRMRGVELQIAINVSTSMLSDVNLPATVQQALELWDVPPACLTLEVTESAMMDDVEGSIATLHELKRIGTRLSLDDFGTGYSSFAYLRRMPLDELKIDQLFVRSLATLPDGSVDPKSAGDLRIVRSIVDIAHNFDLHTVAEGVEDEATLRLLEGLGCDVIQGYFTGRPMPLAMFDQWLDAKRSRSEAVDAAVSAPLPR